MMKFFTSQLQQNNFCISRRGLTLSIHFNNKKIDYSNYPSLKEEDLEERFIRGSGPGGQAVNMTSNCVFLKHLPTNLTVKCHTYRSASQNRTEARKLLADKLDAYLNGENSIQAQIKAIENKRSAQRVYKQTKRNEMKKKWKERENLETTSQE